MNTVFNLSSPKNTISQGLVEIIDVYDAQYFTLAVDGQIIGNIYKDSYQSYVLKRNFINDCVKFSGKTENELVFVYVAWHMWSDNMIKHYDSNRYLDDYSNFIHSIQQYGPVNEQCIKILATGIDDLEMKI